MNGEANDIEGGGKARYDCPTCEVVILGVTEEVIKQHHYDECNPLGVLYV